MKRLNNSGFTIIETMLFLAITGALIAGLLVGVGGSINAQRYRDSVVSLQSFLQRQYSNVSNVQNDIAMGDVSACSGAKGQSDCVIVGKYITPAPAGSVQNLEVQTVLLNLTPNSIAGSNDIDAITNGNIYTTTINETYNLDWGVSVKSLLSTSESDNFSILIIRSPSSGVILTFIDPGSTISSTELKNALKGSISNLTSSNSISLCVNPNGLSGGTPSAVTVNAGSANASGVETKGETSGC